MKKRILATLISLVLMLQAFCFTAYAAEKVISYDSDKNEITVTVEGLEADKEVSLIAYKSYDEDADNDADENIDYLNQYTVEASGTLEVTYPSNKTWAYPDVIAVRVNGVVYTYEFDAPYVDDPVAGSVTLDNDAQSVSVVVSGLTPLKEYDVTALYGAEDDFADTIIADANGELTIAYTSAATWANGDVITINVAGIEIKATVSGIIVPTPEPEEIACEITYDAKAKSVSLAISGLPASKDFSLMAYYNDVKDLDYIDQYTADEDGTYAVNYLSRQEVWANGAVIKAVINGKEFTETLVIEDEIVIAIEAAEVEDGVSYSISNLVVDNEYALVVLYNGAPVDSIQFTADSTTKAGTYDYAAGWENGGIVSFAIGDEVSNEVTLEGIEIIIIPVDIVAEEVDGGVAYSISDLVVDKEYVITVYYDGELYATLESFTADSTTAEGMYAYQAGWENGKEVSFATDGVSSNVVTLTGIDTSIYATSVRIDAIALVTVKVATVGTFVAKPVPSDANVSSWESSNDAVLKVTGNGSTATYKAFKAGVVTVKVTYAASPTTSVSSTITVRVNP